MSEDKKMDAAKTALARKRGLRQTELASQDGASQDTGAEATPGGAGGSGQGAAGAEARHSNGPGAAFVRAQSEFEAITFDKQNPHYRSKYASLTAVLKATLPALNRNGIALTSQTAVDGENIVVRTCLVYGGAVFAEAVWPVGRVGTPPQQLGSALTYARRYSIQSILGVAAEDDDDGNAAQGSAGAEALHPAEADPF